MTVLHREDREGRQVLLTLRIDRDTWQQALDEAFVRVRDLFPDCADRARLEAAHGADALYQEAVNATFPGALTEAVKAEGLTVVGAPDLEITAIGPDGYTFTALIQLYPQVKLGQYKGLKAVYPRVELSDEDVTAALAEYCRAHAISIPMLQADRGDEVTLDFEGFVDGVAFEGGKAENYPLVLGSGTFIPGFEEQLLGIRPEEEREIRVTFPRAYAPELAGKDATFRVKAHAVTRRSVPAPDDAFALSQGFADAAELRRSVMTQALARKEEDARGAFADALVQQVIDGMEVDLPPAMVEDQITGLIAQLTARLQAQGMKLEQYLELGGLTEEDLRDQARSQAETGARYELAMMEIARLENITVTEQDVEPEYERLSRRHGVPVQQVKQLLPVLRLIHETRLLRARSVVVDSAVRL
ncbi:MAG: trigger factor [Oscillospiraceae bacterium]|nr:trigger factor [Oscillospiraceae bacterium]